MIRASHFAIATACSLLILAGAGREPAASGGKNAAGAGASELGEGHVQPSSLSPPEVTPTLRDVGATTAPLYYLNWYTVNGGGATSVNGTNFRTSVSTGQAASGFVTGTNYRVGVGFWYAGACPIALPGDVNVNGLISSSDIIVLVNYVFKAGPAPLPCLANGDVNCNGAVSSSDIIYIVNKVFRAGPEPCNICTIIPSVWSCP